MVDLFGRKKVLIAGTALFSVFTALSAFSPNFTTLVILRVIAGLGEGAIFPVPYLMISELVNKRARGRIMGYAQWVLNCGYTLPALVGLWSVNTFSPDWSWRVPCLIGGLPLLLIPLLIVWVPESPRFLLRRAAREGSDDARRQVPRAGREDRGRGRAAARRVPGRPGDPRGARGQRDDRSRYAPGGCCRRPTCGAA